MAKLKKEWIEFVTNLLVLGAGAYFVWKRAEALEHLIIGIAIALLAGGLIAVGKWLFTKPRPDAGKLALPIFAVVVSIVVYALRWQIAGFTPMLIGIAALLGGIVQSLAVIKSVTGKEKAWWLHAPSAILWIVFGVLVVTGVIDLNAIFALVVGILLIVLGVIGLAESVAVLFLRKE